MSLTNLAARGSPKPVPRSPAVPTLVVRSVREKRLIAVLCGISGPKLLTATSIPPSRLVTSMETTPPGMKNFRASLTRLFLRNRQRQRHQNMKKARPHLGRAFNALRIPKAAIQPIAKPWRCSCLQPRPELPRRSSTTPSGPGRRWRRPSGPPSTRGRSACRASLPRTGWG